MNRYYSSSPENDALIQAEAASSGTKIGTIINTSIRENFLPMASPLRVEAAFLLNRHIEGKLTPWETKQSISRGVRWMGTHPLQDCHILEKVFSYFSFGPLGLSGAITGNDFVQGQMDTIFSLLKNRVPGHEISAPGYDGLVADVLACWQYIWQEKIVYDVLSTIVFNYEPYKDFQWYDGVQILRTIDRAAWQQWCAA